MKSFTMLNIKNISIITIMFISVCSMLQAQKLVVPEFKPVDHELNGYIGGGAYTTSYKSDYFKNQWGVGGGFGLRYTYYFKPEWGILTGFDFSFHNASIKGSINEKYDINNRIDIMEYTIMYTNIKENHHFSYLQIPLMAHYKFPFKSVLIYGSAGGKIGFNICSKYNTHIDEIYTEAVYSSSKKPFKGSLEDGYGWYFNQNTFGSTVAKISYSVCLETGVELYVKSKQSLQLGIFFEYGLNNIATTSSPINKIVDFEENFIANTYHDNLKMKGVIESGAGEKPYFEKISLITIGIKVGFTLGIPQ